MKKNLNERTAKEKIVHIITRLLRVLFWICVVFFAILSFKEGEYVSKPLLIGLLMIPVGIYNIIQIRNQHQGNEEEKKKFSRIIIRSVILTFILMTLFVTGTVIYIVYIK